MSSKFSTPRFPPTAAEKKPEAPKGDNALWRVPEWFPDLNPSVIQKMQIYHSELLKFNSKLNLISRNTERDADEAHFADCILATKLMAKVNLNKPVYDFGAGNGFPGIILSILIPNVEFRMVESDSRKCEFLKHMVAALELKNAQVLNVRVETLLSSEMEIAVSRGFASISKALLATNKGFQKGGRLYHLKGSNWSSEIAEIPTQLISLWSPELIGEYTLPDTQARRVVVCTTKN